MRILHFCNYADLVGGAEVYAHGLVRALRERGHEAVLFGSSPERELDEAGLRVVRRPTYDAARLIRDPEVLDAWRELVARFRPDVVHAHNVFSVALEVVNELGRGPAPLVQTVHDFQLLCPNSWCVRGDLSPCPGGAGAQCFAHGCERNHPYDAWDVLLSGLRQRLTQEGTAVALAPSVYLMERLTAHGWRDVRHLPYFIDFVPAPPAVRQEARLLFVGRLEKEKGVDVLLDAMPAIVAAVPRARLTLVGGGSTERSLRARAGRLGLGRAIEFRSRMERAEIAALYSTAAACVLPSVWSENSPLVAHECLLSGLPLIGSRCGGIPELIGDDCGFVFAPGNPQDLAETVIRFLELPAEKRELMSVRARERARTFQKQPHVERVESLYAELCRRGPGAQPSATWSEALSVLEHLRLQFEAKAGLPTPLQAIRGICRRLGLPKIFWG